MKTLVVYYSLSGTTRQVALAAARELDAETAEVTTRKHYTTKAIVPLMLKSLLGLVRINAPKVNVRDYEVIVVAAPVWAGHVAAPMKAWMKQVELAQKQVAFLVTCGGQAGSTLAQMGKLAPNAHILGEIAIVSDKREQSELDEQARLWADELREDYRRAQSND